MIAATPEARCAGDIIELTPDSSVQLIKHPVDDNAGDRYVQPDRERPPGDLHVPIEPAPVRADLVEPLWSVYPLSWNFTVADAALHEYVGIARYHVYNALGLNAPKAK